MNATLSMQTDAGADELQRLATQITRLETLSSDWDAHHAGILTAFKSSIEELNREAFRRLIRFLREDPAAAERLRAAVHEDPLVFGVLRFHGLVKDPLAQRVEQALEEVRPFLRQHGGDVELVAIQTDAVEVRLVGACHGCPASGQTLSEGVERSIKLRCPEIQHVRQVSRAPQVRAQPQLGEPQVVHFVSPFARSRDQGWEPLCRLDEIADGGIATRTHQGRELLLYRSGDTVSCANNVCAHMGMPLDGGELVGGTLRCPYHGFTYQLETGECLTVPEVQLTMHAVKIVGDQVVIRLAK
jgi:Fe-S cluster biogenesis protein NfuA/nitrite reductase/ring-hydroxylating ferredoxin subunit